MLSLGGFLLDSRQVVEEGRRYWSENLDLENLEYLINEIMLFVCLGCIREWTGKVSFFVILACFVYPLLRDLSVMR